MCRPHGVDNRLQMDRFNLSISINNYVLDDVVQHIFDKNIKQIVSIFDLVLTKDANSFKAICEMISAVSEAATEAVKCLGVAIESFMAL
jgi:hypothetical protein